MGDLVAAARAVGGVGVTRQITRERWELHRPPGMRVKVFDALVEELCALEMWG